MNKPQMTWIATTEAFATWGDLTASGLTWAELCAQTPTTPTEENSK